MVTRHRTGIPLSEEQRKAIDRALRQPGALETITALVEAEMAEVMVALNAAARASLTNPEARTGGLMLEGRRQQLERIRELLDRDWNYGRDAQDH